MSELSVKPDVALPAASQTQSTSKPPQQEPAEPQFKLTADEVDHHRELTQMGLSLSEGDNAAVAQVQLTAGDAKWPIMRQKPLSSYPPGSKEQRDEYYRRAGMHPSTSDWPVLRRGSPQMRNPRIIPDKETLGDALDSAANAGGGIPQSPGTAALSIVSEAYNRYIRFRN